MSLKIASWNIEGSLSITDPKVRGNSTQILAMLRELNADIVTVAESYSEDSIDALAALPQLVALGYRVYSVPYQDDMALRKDAIALQSSLMLLSKLPVRKLESVRLGDFRNGLVAMVEYKSGHLLRVIGVHLDDRLEETRLRQVVDLSKIVKAASLPTVVMGDFNAMHGSDLWPAKFLRSPLMKLLSYIVLPSLSRRAVEMARGEALRSLGVSSGLVDADPRHQPTATPKIRGLAWMPSIRLIQIDHIFISQSLAVRDYTVAADGGADHRAISADISFERQ